MEAKAKETTQEEINRRIDWIEARVEITTLGREYVKLQMNEMNSALSERVRELEEALQKIERWELPDTEEVWADGDPVSYGAKFGTNGERDYIKSIAKSVLNSHEQENRIHKN